MTDRRPPRVFISYRHEPEHADLVLALADRLRGEGIDAALDRYEVIKVRTTTLNENG